MLADEPILPGIVKGCVYDAKTGSPIAGGEVTVCDTDSFFSTGSNGEYLMILPAASHTLLAEAPGYQTEELEIKITFGEPLTQDIKLKGLV